MSHGCDGLACLCVPFVYDRTPSLKFRVLSIIPLSVEKKKKKEDSCVGRVNECNSLRFHLLSQCAGCRMNKQKIKRLCPHIAHECLRTVPQVSNAKTDRHVAPALPSWMLRKKAELFWKATHGSSDSCLPPRSWARSTDSTRTWQRLARSTAAASDPISWITMLCDSSTTLTRSDSSERETTVVEKNLLQRFG